MQRTVDFTDKYAGRVSGDFVSRFARIANEEQKVARAQAEIDRLRAAGKQTANFETKLARAQDQLTQARAETETATDILEGRTPLGDSRSVRAIPESQIKGVETPDFQVSGGGMPGAPVEVKAVGEQGKLGKGAIDRNFRKAACIQISGQATATGGKAGVIRLDASATGTFPETNEEIGSNDSRTMAVELAKVSRPRYRYRLGRSSGSRTVGNEPATLEGRRAERHDCPGRNHARESMTSTSQDPNDDAPAREPIEDTWRWKQDAASWAVDFDGPVGDQTTTVNHWWSDLIARPLDDFAPLARAREVTLVDEQAAKRIAWRPHEPYVRFRERLLNAIRQHPAPLTNVDLDLDLRVWFRTKESPDRPVLAWLSFPGTRLVIYVDRQDRHGWALFELAHSLFSALTYPDMDDNRELHALNQPLLADALQRWQRRAGVPLQFEEDLAGTFEFGFSSDPDDY